MRLGCACTRKSARAIRGYQAPLATTRRGEDREASYDKVLPSEVTYLALGQANECPEDPYL